MKKLDDLVYRPTEEEKVEFTTSDSDEEDKNFVNYLTYIPKELSETAKMMVSADYRIRFRGEYFQEKIRAEKLENYILKIEVGMEKDSKICSVDMFISNQPLHDCPLELLQEQLYTMKEKLRIFKKRAIYEKIKLE